MILKKYKQLLLGIVVGAVTFGATPLHAAIDQYILQKADYKVEINGKEYIDENNPILTKNGTTYAPLRSMLGAAGLNIEWDADKGVAKVGEKNVVYFENLASYTDENGVSVKVLDGASYVGVYEFYNNFVRNSKYDFKQFEHSDGYMTFQQLGTISIINKETKQVVSTIEPLKIQIGTLIFKYGEFREKVMPYFK